MDLKFPLDRAPTCLDCGQPCEHRITSSRNTNGNAGRPYYFCSSNHDWRFSCWDDDRGISSTNPTCTCGLRSREFTAYEEQYYGCPIGACDWTISVSGLWSNCSKIEEFFGPPIVIDFSTQSGQPSVNIELGADFRWNIRTEFGESPLCSICQMALEKLRTPRDSLTTSISPEVRSRAGCHLCTLFIHCASTRGGTIQTQEPENIFKYGFEEMDLGLSTLYLEWKKSGRDSNSGWVCRVSELGCFPSVANMSHNVSSNFFAGSFEKIMSLAQQWIQGCETAHPSCQNERTSNFVPTRVIDVGEKKIFHSNIKPILRNRQELPLGSNYLTLSHTWGGVVPMRLLSNNIASMMKHIPFDQLPKTFQDAIIVTQNLGLRYVWIDSLCIIQDDDNDWQREAALMAEVYKYSTCNISAAGAANSSFGLLLDHNPILMKPVKARFITDNRGVVVHDFWPENLLCSFEEDPLMNRGWVVQERLLSRRNLHFSRDQVIWECRSDSACTVFPDKAPFKVIPHFLKHHLSRVVYSGDRGPESLTEVWTVLVSRYTQCELTYATDKLVAFGGIASTFCGLLGLRYVAGLWLENLPYQLCWIGKRRIDSTYVAPSWSWASANGSVRNAFLPVHPSHVVRQIEVLEAHVDFVSQNPYGQLRGGHLRVAGRLALAKFVFEDNEARPLVLLPDAKRNYHVTRDDVNLSWTKREILEAQRHSLADGMLHILAVLEHLNAEREYQESLRGKPQMNPRRAPCTRWLILCPTKNPVGTFVRCGTLTVDDSSHALFTQACQWYDQRQDHLPIHSYQEQTGAKYAVTIV